MKQYLFLAIIILYSAITCTMDQKTNSGHNSSATKPKNTPPQALPHNLQPRTIGQ